MCLTAHFPDRDPVIIMHHACTLHEIDFEAEKRAAALERAPYVCHLQFSWQVNYVVLVVVNQIAYVEVAGVYMQVAPWLNGVRGNADCARVV